MTEALLESGAFLFVSPLGEKLLTAKVAKKCREGRKEVQKPFTTEGTEEE